MVENVMLRTSVAPEEMHIIDHWNALTKGDLHFNIRGLKMAAPASRDSGKITTSVGNTAINWGVWQSVCCQIMIETYGWTFEQCVATIRSEGGIHYGRFASLVEGDDNVAAVNDEVFMRIM